VINGATLGDLRADNVRTLMFQAEISPMETTPSGEVVECELSYSREIDGVSAKFVARSSVWMNFTHDAQVVNSLNNEVRIHSSLQKISEIDRELADAMTSDEEQAKTLLQKEIAILEEVVDIDTNQFNGKNKISELLKQSKKNLEELKEQGVTKQQIKEVHHRGYTVTRG